MFELMKNTLFYVLDTLQHNALWLLIGIFIASAIRVYMDPEKLRKVLMKSSKVSIPSTVAFGAFTPFCACGTMAIVVSMLTTVLPWGAIMAFLTSSPLMSPEFFIMLSGIVSPGFAVALLLSSILIGLVSGFLTHWIESHTHWLDHQARFSGSKPATADAAAFCCSQTKECQPSPVVTCCSPSGVLSIPMIFSPNDPYKIKAFLRTLIDIGFKQILMYFSVFAAVGYWINQFVPKDLIVSLFGADNFLAVPLAALLGIPLYVSGSSSLPILDSLMSGGASSGVLLAFMITGPGTSLGAITGIFTIMKKKALLLYVAYLFFGAILAGYVYNLLLNVMG